MKKYIYTKFIDENGNEQEKLFTCWYEYHSRYFNPEVKEVKTLVLESKGKSYSERKAHIIELADNFKNENLSGLTFLESQRIVEFFEAYSKTYGLRKVLVQCNIISA